MGHRRGFLVLLAGALSAVLSGCTGYHLGPSNGVKAGAKSVQIVPFVNRALEPRLGDAVTSALRKEAQRDGTYRLETRGEGDIVVTGVILEYDRREQTLVSTDVITARDYQLRIVAQVTARERASGKILLDQRVMGHTLVRVGADLTRGDRQGLPLLATDLAKRMTALLVDGKW